MESIVKKLKAIYGHIVSWIKRAGAARLGWYGALALLLTLLGSASYAYRNRAVVRISPTSTPQAVMAVHTPDPLTALVTMPEPTPVPTEAPLEYQWPIEGEIIGTFADDHMVWDAGLNQWQTHPALDIAAAPGEAVAACAEGVVADAWQDGVWGCVVTIEHPDGAVSTYANLNTLKLAPVGTRVEAGQIIGAVGQSAAAESELPPHLHFMLQKDGSFVSFEKIMAINKKSSCGILRNRL